MKPIRVIVAAAALAITTLMLGNCNCLTSEARLASQAKISKEQAQKTALAHVKRGTVKEAELEKEGGKLIWSFDIAQAGTKNISEVHVDAITGAFLKTEIESEEDEAREGDHDEKAKAH